MSEKKYAIIATGGKQYKVSEGDSIDVELLGVEDGGSVEFDQVLTYANGDEFQVGTPHVDSIKVKATALATKKDKKVISFKHKRRKTHRKKTGHRQKLTTVKIESIG